MRRNTYIMTSMKIKFAFLFTIAFTLSFGSIRLYAQEPEVIPIVIPHPPGNHPHAPQLSQISCYLFSNIESLALSSNTISENALILIENISTGDFSMEEVYISSIPETLPLIGPGNYSITITLSSGPVYFGSFSYNNT